MKADNKQRRLLLYVRPEVREILDAESLRRYGRKKLRGLVLEEILNEWKQKGVFHVKPAAK